MDFKGLLVLTAFIINLFLSLLIHFRAQKTKSNMMFEISAFSITGWCLSMFLYRLFPFSVDVWVKVLYLFPLYIPLSLLLFGMYFPNKQKISRIAVTSIITSGVVMTILTLWSGTIIRSVKIVPGQENIIYFGWAYYYFYIIYIEFFFFITFYVFIKKYFVESPLHRIQILYILIGTCIATFPSMFTNLIFPTLGNFRFNWLGQVATVFWVGGIAYAIIRHRLMDIRALVVRTITFSLLISILGLIYVAGVLIFGKLLFSHYSQNEQFFLSLFLSLLLVLSFEPLKRYLERITNTIFYKNKYNPNLLLEKLGKIMASTLNLDHLIDLILNEIIVQMKPTYVAFIIMNDLKFSWNRLLGSAPFSIEQIDTEGIWNVVHSVVRKPGENVIVFEELPEGEGAVHSVMTKYSAKILLPLVVEEEIIGALLLGDKSSGEIYSSGDINVLSILSSEIAIAVKNALSYEEILKFNVTLKEEVDRATADLQKANEHLKQLDHLKDEFVSLASHELRTPMTVVKSYLWMVLQDKKGKLNKQQKLYLERAATASDGLINLVNDMLNVSRIESGRFSIEKQKIDIKELVGTTVKELTPEAEKRGLHLSFHLESKDIPTFSLDPERIKQVLINLIGNSLKFTPKNGSISVALSKSDSHVVVQIKDNGVGISKENLAKLFQKFGLLRESYQKSDTQGTGLGLYICKSIVELHGGKIWAESEGEGKGATFTFSLPIK